MGSSATKQTAQPAATLQALKSGLSAAAPAAGNFDGWIFTLNRGNNAGLSAAAYELENLKTAVGSGDASKTEPLRNLGEHTTKAATNS